MNREPQFEIGSFHTIGRTKYIVESVNTSKATLRALKTGKVKVVELGVKEKKGESNTLLALDASTKATGWAIFKNGKLYKSGVICPRATLDVYKRIKVVADRIEDIIEEYSVNELISEDIYYGGNIHTFEVLSMLKGVINYVSNKRKLKIYYVLPNVWKSHFSIARKDSECGKKLAIELCRKKVGRKLGEDESESVLIGMYKLEKERKG